MNQEEKLIDVLYEVVKQHLEHFERKGVMRYFSGMLPCNIAALRMLAKYGRATLDDGNEQGLCAVLRERDE